MIFINYRKQDSRFVARALAECLKYRFGPSQVFLDEMSIADGSEWPDALQRGLKEAKVLLSLMGPNWLRSHDEFGRRRLDDPDDWVRLELLQARALQKKILIRLVGGNNESLKKPALPTELQWLSDIQAKPLNDTNWQDDLQALIRELRDNFGYKDANILPPLPDPDAKGSMKGAEVLEPDRILAEIKRLDVKGWSLVENAIPPRLELRKMYQFESFLKAVSFMEFASVRIDEAKHHPRWENQFKSVTVYFSTWDVGSRVTHLDIEAAKTMDDFFNRFQENRERDSGRATA